MQLQAGSEANRVFYPKIARLADFGSGVENADAHDLRHREGERQDSGKGPVETSDSPKAHATREQSQSTSDSTVVHLRYTRLSIMQLQIHISIWPVSIPANNP